MPDREIIFNSRKRLFETNVKKKKREEKRKIRYNSLSVREKRLPDDCLSRKILVIFVGEKKKEKEKDSKLNRETRKKETFTRDNGMKSQYQHGR